MRLSVGRGRNLFLNNDEIVFLQPLLEDKLEIVLHYVQNLHFPQVFLKLKQVVRAGVLNAREVSTVGVALLEVDEFLLNQDVIIDGLVEKGKRDFGLARHLLRQGILAVFVVASLQVHEFLYKLGPV